MNEDEKNYHIYRIISGYTIVEVDETIYIIDTPTPEILNEANFYFNRALRQNKFSEMFDLDLARVFLIKEKIWTLTGDDNLKEIDKSLDNAKMELYHAFFLNEKAITTARRRIEAIRKKKNEELNKKHLIDDATVEGLANLVKETHIISRLVLNSDYEKVIIEDGLLLEKINKAYTQELLNHSQYRLLARSEEWRSIWNVLGKEAFRKIGNEQIILATYSRLYDNVAEHSESPPKAVIEDDDMLDGWLVYIAQQSEQNRDHKTTNKYFDQKHQKAGEIFIPVSSPAEINKVLSMNDTRGKIIQRQIHNTVDRQGTATDMDIPEKVLDMKGKHNGK